jgi:hypothetical protein
VAERPAWPDAPIPSLIGQPAFPDGSLLDGLASPDVSMTERASSSSRMSPSSTTSRAHNKYFAAVRLKHPSPKHELRFKRRRRAAHESHSPGLAPPEARHRSMTAADVLPAIDRRCRSRATTAQWYAVLNRCLTTSSARARNDSRTVRRSTLWIDLNNVGKNRAEMISEHPNNLCSLHRYWCQTQP